MRSPRKNIPRPKLCHLLPTNSYTSHNVVAVQQTFPKELNSLQNTTTHNCSNMFKHNALKLPTGPNPSMAKQLQKCLASELEITRMSPLSRHGTLTWSMAVTSVQRFSRPSEVVKQWWCHGGTGGECSSRLAIKSHNKNWWWIDRVSDGYDC